MTLLTQCHFVLSMVESYWKEAVFKIPECETFTKRRCKMVKVKEITSDFQNKKSRINRDFFQNVLLQAEDYKNLQMTLKKYIYSKKNK
jgi:hypothetical protein